MRTVRVFAALIFGALVFGANDLNSCSFEPLHAIFFAAGSLENPDQNFAKGELGILLPGFRRASLVVAYRYLNGLKLTAPIALPEDPLVRPGVNVMETWNAARTVIGLPPIQVNPYKEDSESHSFFLNCKDDAFRTASETLTALIKSQGVASDAVKQWAAAQDIVFQNCSGGPAIPQPLAGSADRAYQIAAAHFYSGQYDAARAEFAAIANDSKSPWRGLAPYLIARTMIREGNLSDAEKQVLQILKNPNQKEGHERADHLEAWLKIRLYPAERMVEVANAVMDPVASNFGQSLHDYTYLYDQLERQQGALEKAAEANDLTDWILDFQHSDAAEGHALERWRATHSTPWLIAALAAKPDDFGARAELLKAADMTPPQSPGFLTVQYFADTMLEGDAARARLDQLLAASRPPRGARNLLLAARMRWARSWLEFLRDAPRQPVDMDGYDYSVEGPTSPHTTDEIGFDADAIYVWNHFVPLSLQAGAALDVSVPLSARRELAISAWTKAVLLNQLAIARKLSPVIGVELEGPDAEFATVWDMLRNPGMHPYPEAGFGRVMKIDRLDQFRDNWWCKVDSIPDAPMGYELLNLYGQAKPSADFLSAEQRETAKSEDEKLRELPAGADWLAAETLRFAKAQPVDERVPEALHLAVRATRYGCAGEHTAAYSREAFDLLHTKYGNSQWAKDTPYWFKN